MTTKADIFSSVSPTALPPPPTNARPVVTKSGEHPAVRAYHTTLANCGAVATLASRRLTAQIHAAADALEAEPPVGGAEP